VWEYCKTKLIWWNSFLKIPVSGVRFTPWAPIKTTTIGGSIKTNLQAPADAYLLCSVCGHLVISEMINVPVIVVSLYFPCCALVWVLRFGPSNDHIAKPNSGVQDLGGRRRLPEGDQGDSLPGCWPGTCNGHPGGQPGHASAKIALYPYRSGAIRLWRHRPSYRGEIKPRWPGRYSRYTFGRWTDRSRMYSPEPPGWTL